MKTPRVVIWVGGALSDSGSPSSSRLISAVGLLVLAPLLLVGCLLKAHEQFGLAFEVWVSICGGVYVGGRFAPRGGASTTTSESASSSTTTTP